MVVVRLRQRRLTAVLTQAELAQRAGVSEATVVAAEQGKRVRISTVRKLAEALGVAPGVLTTEASPTAGSLEDGP